MSEICVGCVLGLESEEIHVTSRQSKLICQRYIVKGDRDGLTISQRSTNHRTLYHNLVHLIHESLKDGVLMYYKYGSYTLSISHTCGYTPSL